MIEAEEKKEKYLHKKDGTAAERIEDKPATKESIDNLNSKTKLIAVESVFSAITDDTIDELENIKEHLKINSGHGAFGSKVDGEVIKNQLKATESLFNAIEEVEAEDTSEQESDDEIEIHICELISKMTAVEGGKVDGDVRFALKTRLTNEEDLSDLDSPPVYSGGPTSSGEQEEAKKTVPQTAPSSLELWR